MPFDSERKSVYFGVRELIKILREKAVISAADVTRIKDASNIN